MPLPFELPQAVQAEAEARFLRTFQTKWRTEYRDQFWEELNRILPVERRARKVFVEFCDVLKRMDDVVMESQTILGPETAFGACFSILEAYLHPPAHKGRAVLAVPISEKARVLLKPAFGEVRDRGWAKALGVVDGELYRRWFKRNLGRTSESEARSFLIHVLAVETDLPWGWCDWVTAGKVGKSRRALLGVLLGFRQAGPRATLKQLLNSELEALKQHAK